MLCLLLEYRRFQSLIKPQHQLAPGTEAYKYRRFQSLIKPQHGWTIPMLYQKYRRFQSLIKPQPVTFFILSA